MDVSWNIATPKSSIYRWIFPCKPSGYCSTPIYGNPHMKITTIFGSCQHQGTSREIRCAAWSIRRPVIKMSCAEGLKLTNAARFFGISHDVNQLENEDFGEIHRSLLGFTGGIYNQIWAKWNCCCKKTEPRSTKIYRKSRAPPPTPSIAMLEFGESKFKPYSEGL